MGRRDCTCSVLLANSTAEYPLTKKVQFTILHGVRTQKSLVWFTVVSTSLHFRSLSELSHVCPVMPAKAMLFDQSVRTLHDFGSSFYNFISFNPHSRLIALAGFGNLAGTCDIFDRRSLTKLSTIDASNTSYCEWSPDGKFLLTATLSPRLRVDNGIKVWYILGQLIHVQTCDELYQANWRPTPVDIAPQFPQAIPPAPAPSANAIAHAAVAKPTPSKTAGAYRPPGLRGQVASLVYKREDENGSPGRTPNGSGAATPTAPGVVPPRTRTAGGMFPERQRRRRLVLTRTRGGSGKV